MQLSFRLIPLIFAITVSARAAEAVPPIVQPKRVATSIVKDPIALSALAEQLASYGDSSNEFAAYYLAAKILKNIRVVDTTRVGEQADNSRYAFCLERAKELAGNSATRQSEIDLLESTLARGTLSGLAQHRGVLASNLSQSFKLTFKGGEDAGVLLLLDVAHSGYANRSEIDLDMYIRDEEGRNICSLEGPGVPELCAWTPSATGKFTAQVVNRGKVEAPFVLNFR